jgi:hypothetical protein
MRHLVTLAVAALLLAVPTAMAKDSQSVEGSYIAVPAGPMTFAEHSKNVCVIQMPLSFVMTGDLNGSFDVTATLSVKKLPQGACSPGMQNIPAIFAARATIHGQGSFRSFAAAEDTFDGTFVARHDGGFATGRIVVKHGTGDFAGVHGILHSAGKLGYPGLYNGELHFAP